MHLLVAVAGLDPFAHQDAQVVGQRRLGIVDRFVLAHHAAQFLGQRAGARFQRRVRQHLVGLDRPRAERATSNMRGAAARACRYFTAVTPPAAARLRAGLCFGRPRRADAQPPIRKRQAAAEEHDDGAEPDQQHVRLEIEPHRHGAVWLRIAERKIELARRRASSARLPWSPCCGPGKCGGSAP